MGWLCLLLLVMQFGCGATPDLETSRKFQAAEEQFAKASTPEDYVRVAAVYQEIIDDGFTSGIVCYNQGNAWMQAGEIGRAIASYRQAQRHLPRDPYLDANLRQARVGLSAVRKTPLLDYVFFWQHSVSYREKTVLTTVLLGIAMLLSLGAQLEWHKTAMRRLSLTMFIVTLLLGVSLARDWYDIEQVEHGVVATETTARKGGSESYEPAFTDPLPTGTEFTVLSEQDGWLRIQVGDSGNGWIPARDGVVY